MTQEARKSLELPFTCPLSSGLHARPASRIAEAVDSFASDCILTNLRNGLTANMKSVLSIIAADVRHHDKCLLQIRGDDEQLAYSVLQNFIERELAGCDVPVAGTVVSSPSFAPPRVLQATGAKYHLGFPVSPGIAHGKVMIVDSTAMPANSDIQEAAEPDRELERVTRAMAAVRGRIQEKLAHSSSATEVDILKATLAMAADVSFAGKVRERIREGKSASQAIVETGRLFATLLRQSDSEDIRARALDIEEICGQLLDAIGGADFRGGTSIELREPTILVTETIAPQQFLALDRKWLSALILEHYSPTSHTAILARSLGIPTLAGVKRARILLTPGREVVVDATRGLVIPQPSLAVSRFYQRELHTLQRRQEFLARRALAPAITADGKTLEVAANAASLEESVLAFENGAEGIGLFRTEIAFLKRDLPPSEEEQFALYAEVTRVSGSRPVIFRTLDLGGDKRVPYLNLPTEDNPFLGFRGIRIYAAYPDLVQAQLRAILRASALGRVQIMAPMVSSLEEVLAFKAAVAQAKRELSLKHIPFDPDIPLGIMIEVPSAAFVLEQLCQEVDFFSIGTNDLNQYFLAVDRENSRVAGLSSWRHPGFLRFLRDIVTEIHKAQKWVGMCGEMASRGADLPLVLGLGLDEISVPVGNIADVKRRISELSAAGCEQLVSRAIEQRTADDVSELLERQHQSTPNQPLLSEDLVLLNSPSESKEEAIQDLVDAFYIAGRTENRDELEEALWNREQVYSTGLGFGFATPHCKSAAVTADSIAILKVPHPINWDSVDREPVRMVIAIAMHEPEAGNRHMQVFSRLARMLMSEEFRASLLKIQETGEMVAYLTQQLSVPVGADPAMSDR